MKEKQIIRLAIPKGRMQEGIVTLLKDAGIKIRFGARNYKPAISLDGFSTKVLKPQNIVEMLHIGSRDFGFTGADWVAELECDAVEVLETGLDPVRIVAAAPEKLLSDGKLPDKKLIIASEYENLTRKWIKKRKLDADFVRSFGATEVFPPEDADCIVDNTATGSTLMANRLHIVEELMTSSTRMYASKKAWQNEEKRNAIERFALLIESVLEARKRVILEINVPEEYLEQVIAVLPSMRKPTVAHLYGEKSYAIKVAAPRDQLPVLIHEIKSRGGSDIVILGAQQIVP